MPALLSLPWSLMFLLLLGNQYDHHMLVGKHPWGPMKALAYSALLWLSITAGTSTMFWSANFTCTSIWFTLSKSQLPPSGWYSYLALTAPCACIHCVWTFSAMSFSQVQLATEITFTDPANLHYCIEFTAVLGFLFWHWSLSLCMSLWL